MSGFIIVSVAHSLRFPPRRPLQESPVTVEKSDSDIEFNFSAPLQPVLTARHGGTEMQQSASELSVTSASTAQEELSQVRNAENQNTCPSSSRLAIKFGNRLYSCY